MLAWKLERRVFIAARYDVRRAPTAPTAATPAIPAAVLAVVLAVVLAGRRTGVETRFGRLEDSEDFILRGRPAFAGRRVGALAGAGLRVEDRRAAPEELDCPGREVVRRVGVGLLRVVRRVGFDPLLRVVRRVGLDPLLVLRRVGLDPLLVVRRVGRLVELDLLVLLRLVFWLDPDDREVVRLGRRAGRELELPERLLPPVFLVISLFLLKLCSIENATLSLWLPSRQQFANKPP
jgi:hypothetical protein